MKNVVLVRHADIDLPRLSADPPLSSAGRERAAALARLVGEAGVTAILTSRFARTKQTVGPLVAQTGLQPVEAPPAPETAEMIMSGVFGDVVLIAGHSDTVPEMIGALNVPAPLPTIGEQEFDNCFLVAADDPAKEGGMIRLRYGSRPS